MFKGCDSAQSLKRASDVLAALARRWKDVFIVCFFSVVIYIYIWHEKVYISFKWWFVVDIVVVIMYTSCVEVPWFCFPLMVIHPFQTESWPICCGDMISIHTFKHALPHVCSCICARVRFSIVVICFSYYDLTYLVCVCVCRELQIRPLSTAASCRLFRNSTQPCKSPLPYVHIFHSTENTLILLNIIMRT